MCFSQGFGVGCVDVSQAGNFHILGGIIPRKITELPLG